MTAINFYSSNFPEYFWQKPHYNLGNKIVNSNFYKTLNPIRARYDYNGNDYTQMPIYLGVVPQFFWLYGNLDYSFNKYHRHYQAHDDWYPDRKGKTLGHKNGSFCSPTLKQSKYMTLRPNFIPRGCIKEIRSYHLCKAKNGGSEEACFTDKISIMEVCPDHILEGLREKKKWYLRAEMIDNDTYKRAMTVSDFNRNRSVSDLKLKTWDWGKTANLRSDGLWQDDRWDPTAYSHPHRYDNVNFPEQEYKDFFGGTIGTAEAEEYERNRLDSSGNSTAIRQHQSQKRMNKLKGVVAEVKDLNEKDHKHH
jgi:hypothetical protein